MDAVRWLEGLLTAGNVALVMGVSVGSFLLSTAVVAMLVLRFPPGYLRGEELEALVSVRHPVLRLAVRTGQILLGVVLLALGAVMAVPGVPGQGLLTMLAGALVLGVPGRHRLARALLSRPHVLSTVNRLRARFRRPPLLPREAPNAAQNS